MAIDRWYKTLNILFVPRKEGPEAKFLRLAPTVFSSQITCDIASGETIQKMGASSSTLAVLVVRLGANV